MSACEICWAAAFIKSRTLGGSQADHYRAELDAHPEHATPTPAIGLPGKTDETETK